MRYAPIDPQLFINNRRNLKRLLMPNSLAVVNSNDILPTNGDAVLLLRQNSDLFHLTGHRAGGKPAAVVSGRA